MVRAQASISVGLSDCRLAARSARSRSSREGIREALSRMAWNRLAKDGRNASTATVEALSLRQLDVAAFTIIHVVRASPILGKATAAAERPAEKRAEEREVVKGDFRRSALRLIRTGALTSSPSTVHFAGWYDSNPVIGKTPTHPLEAGTSSLTTLHKAPSSAASLALHAPLVQRRTYRPRLVHLARKEMRDRNRGTLLEH